jgi:hypothetical protein
MCWSPLLLRTTLDSCRNEKNESIDRMKLTSLIVSAYWASTYLMTSLTWRSNFNSLPSKKSSPGVSITENSTLSNRDSQISTHAVSIVVVAFFPRRTNCSSTARWSTVAVGEMSAVSRRRRSRDVFPVPLPPTTCSAH